MEGQNQLKQQQIEINKLPQKRTRKNKADLSKASKSSHYTRRRQQPDSSQQNLLPSQIPKSNGSQAIITYGQQNQLSKALIRIPYSLFTTQKFQSLNILLVQGKQIVIKIVKQCDSVSISSRLFISNRKMQIQQQKNEQTIQINDQSSESSQVFQTYVVNIWGKYVYLSHFESQNKVIKKVRKQLNTTQDGQLIKFKVKQINSDLFLYLNLRAEQYFSSDFNGLVNQGNTCYMNSYLQTLYHIPVFRNLVYQAEIQDQNKFPATLQDLFFHLANSQKAVSPQALVKSFGWGKKQASIQQDAQQFSCLFFQALQRKLNQSAPQKGYNNLPISQLFKGYLSHYIACTNVDFRRENYQEFIDLQLPIYPTLKESLNAYTSEVYMDGQNKYRTDQYGQQQAVKGVKISTFPPILMIQLKRFQYSFQQQKNIKILTQLQYQQFFDFSPWSLEQDKFKQEYELYAVLVHEGARAQSGHYYNFIKSDNKWYKFNDENVQQVPPQKVFKYNFGGFNESIQFDAKQMKVQKKLVQSKTTAYMLVYIKCSMKDLIMKQNLIYPEWIKNKQNYKLELQQQKKNKKKFFHNVGFIDWEAKLLGKQAPDIGFLNQPILLKSKDTLQQIAKASKISDWLIDQKIIQAPQNNDGKISKKTKKGAKVSKNMKNQQDQYGSKLSKKTGKQKQTNSQLGIYIYYVTPQRQNLTGFCHKLNHTMEDLLKIGTDPYIFKAPFQAKKQQYIAIIKKYKVQINQQGILCTDIRYELALPISKNIIYPELLQILKDRFQNKKNNSFQDNSEIINHQEQVDVRRCYYIQDWKHGPIDISLYLSAIPVPVPSKNQLLVCVIQQLPLKTTAQQLISYSFGKWYKNKKQTISIQIYEQKTNQFNQIIQQIHINLSLSQFRIIIFNIIKDKRPQILSPDNIVLKAKLKKTSKYMSQAAEPQCNTIKDLMKFQARVQFCFSTLTVQSRQSQYQLLFFYRTKNLDYSEPIKIIANKQQLSLKLIERIKNHPKILQYLQNDGFRPDQSQALLLSKDKRVINDYINNQGKVIHKGDLDNVLKKQKNSVLVIQGRTILQMEDQPTVEIKQQDVEPIVNILLHHVSQSIERVGCPRCFKVDRRMEFLQLKNKILDLIKDQYYQWQNKIVPCNPYKTRIRLFAKDNKKVVELNQYQTEPDIRKLRIQDKNMSKAKSSSRKSSLISNDGIDALQASQNKQKIQEPNNFSSQKVENGQIQQGEQGKISFQQKNQIHDENIQDQLPQQAEVTNISASESTIYSMFPKIRILKMQIIHNELIKPNIALRLNVDF